MENRDLKKLRTSLANGSVQADELERFQFTSSLYQRVFFMEAPSKHQAHKRLAWLWDQLLGQSKPSKNEGSAVIGYPLTADFRHWEIFADVPDEVANYATAESDSLLKQFDSLDRAITTLDDDEFSFVLPNIMLLNEGGLSNVFFSYRLRVDFVPVGFKPQKFKSNPVK